MRKFLLLLLVSIILCGHNLAYGQRGLDTLSEPTIHIKFGDPILFNPIEGAELYQFLFSLYGHVDTIQTSSPYVSASEYEGLQTFESYDVAIRYYENNVWQYSEESKRVMLVTDSGTDHLIHDLLKAGVIPISATRGTRELANPEDPECTETEEEWSEIEIPIVYHVIVPSWFDGEPTDYLSPAKINQSINILNRVFAGETGDLGVDTRIRFKPAANAPVDFCGETYYGITYNTYNGENNINLDPSVTYPGSIYFPSTNNSVINDYYDLFPWQQYINIWVFEEIVYNEMDEVFGITSSPCLSEVNIPMIGLIKDVVGENERLRSRQLGYCVAHEMGHYFGLLHAWIETVTVPHITGDYIEYVTSYVSDGIPDTPDAPGPVTGCDYSQLSRIPYDNIMSYTPDGCRYRFTKDQTTHMRRSICESFGNYSEATNIATVMPQEDILDMRIISPVSTILCSNNYFDLKIMMSDISLFESIEIEGNDNQDPLIFYNPPEPIIGEDNTYAIHIQLDQNLPAGNYNFILHTDCASISKQYNVIACDNNVDMQNAQWYFDSYVTLDFRNGIADLGGYSAMNANSSESGICNEYGDILFYTDGDKIWNSNHEIINELNQSIEDIVYRGTIALKFDNNHYAVVTLCNNGHLYSRLLDGQGNIINTTGSEYSGIIFFSGLTAIPCTTGGFWLVSVKETNMGFDIVSLKITLEGTSFSYELGDVLPTANVFDNNRRPVAIKASPEGKYIVCATDAGMTIYYFNATHGNFDNIGCDAGYGNKGASVAFSPSGRFMYMTFLESGIRIFQYDMESDFSCNCNGLSYNTVFSRSNEGEYSNCTLYLQEGPDGRIYFSKDGDAFSLSRTIGVIMEPDNLASTFHGEQDCHVVDNLIDYPIGTILQNRENLPNLIDAKNIDICAPGFSICSEDCSIETLTLHNFSLSPSLTWTIYDLDGRYLTSSNEIQPDLSALLAPYNNYFAFIIEQYTGAECNKTMRDTISFNAQMHIDGENSICLDGRSYTYSVSLEPSSQIRETIWTSDGFNGDVAFENGRNSDLMITPDVTDQNFTITCNIPDGATQFGCPYTASLDVVANPDCSFVAEVIRFCDNGIIKLTNIIGANLSNYSASIIFNGENQPQPMMFNSDGYFGFKYKNIYCDIEDYYLLEQIHRQYLNATILVSNNTTDNVTEIELLIPRTYTSFNIDGIVSPALCDNDQCVVLVTVSGGDLEGNSSNNINIIPAGETSAGDSMYYLVVHGSNNIFGANIIDDEGNTCLKIKETMPYELREPTFSVLHSDICHAGETGQIIIEMDLPIVQNNHIITATWEDDYEGQTDFVLSHGTIYTTILPNVSAGTYTPTVHYTSNCSITLDPIRINVISLDDPVPTISYPEISYVCNDESTTSLIVEIQNFTGIEDGFVPFAICNGRTYTFGTDTYTTTINDLRQGNYTATVFYTSTCSADITFTVEVIPTPNTIVSHTDICSEDETANITIEMELSYIENGFTPTAIWNNGETTNFLLQEGTTYITTLNNVEAGLYTAEVQYTSNCSISLEEPITIAVSSLEVTYSNVSEDNVGIYLNFDPPLSNYTVVVTENGMTTETAITQNPYYFVTNINNNVVIKTQCGPIILDYRVSDVAVNLKSEACLESDVDISFEISGGVAPYTATFTGGDYTTTQIFNNSGPNVMHAEIIQGVANHLTVVSANGDTYNIDLGTINNISSIAELNTGNLGTTYIGGTYIVSSGLTFDHDVTFDGSTIYCTYEDNDDITSSQWTVNGGKTVTFENCTIKAACPDKMWQGINVKSAPLFIISYQFEGNMTKIGHIGISIPITPIFNEARAYGKVIFRNGSLIEDALKAIESTEGGKIIASGSDFNNNQYDLYYNAHTEAQGNLTSPTISTCTFATTRLLNDNSIFPEAHIYLGGVRGIYVDNCTFGNNMPYSTSTLPEIGTPYYTDHRGIGISSVESNLQTVSTNTFNGLSYAVHVSGLGSIPVQVTNCVMSNVFRGIYINDNNGCIVQDNDITCQNSNLAFIPPEPPGNFVILPLFGFAEKTSTPYGAYLNSCTGFTFEHNTIKRAGTGLYVNNSGGDDNRVENNIFGTAFNGNTNGMVAIGNNSNFVYNGGLGQSGERGLQALCNVFTGNSYDFGVYSGNMRVHQGTETNPAGNQFYKNSINLSPTHKQFTTQGFILIFDYGNNSYTYHHHNDNISGSDINNYYRGLKEGHYDNIIPNPINNIFIENYCDCEVPFEPIIFPRPHPIPFIMSSAGNSGIGEINLLNSELATKTEVLASKIDNGNTGQALAKATAITSTSNITVDDFCTDGYISDTVSKVLKSKIEEKPVAITSVFIENSPLPAETYEEVMETDISSVLKYVLSYYQSGETKCAKDKKEIARISQEIGAKEKILYLSAMYDTTKTVQYEIADVFASQGSVAGKSKAFDILMKNDDFLGAADVITNIRSLGTDAASKYADIAERCIELTVNPDSAKIRLRGEREFLLQLIADNSYLYSGKAMSLYKFAFDTILPDYTPMFEDVIAPKSKSTEVSQLPNIFTVYPNPTTGLVTVIIDRDEINDEMIEFLEHYGMQDIEDCENVTVSILDINGRVLQTQEFNYEEEIILNIGSYVPGAYIVEIRSCFSDVYSTKIIKI